MDLGQPDNLLDQDAVHIGLGKTENKKQLNYKNLFLKTIPDQELNLIRSVTQKGGIIGNKEFIDKIANALGRNIILRQRGRPRKLL